MLPMHAIWRRGLVVEEMAPVRFVRLSCAFRLGYERCCLALAVAPARFKLFESAFRPENFLNLRAQFRILITDNPIGLSAFIGASQSGFSRVNHFVDSGFNHSGLFWCHVFL